MTQVVPAPTRATRSPVLTELLAAMHGYQLKRVPAGVLAPSAGEVLSAINSPEQAGWESGNGGIEHCQLKYKVARAAGSPSAEAHLI
ncbi:hypothetical protein Anapl_18063 [Anas platyrhynchos]|uniref:Uncharacterized protein n=1 Tax=Anas platyrhynchos TaxID=8839 RepID=R0LQV6_ANAPL|nr:hypothetical protein Anapl_18063 [Anas platyrhynchos]